MSGADFVLAAGILLAVAAAVRKCVKDRKKGKTCGCDCTRCSQSCGFDKERL